MMALYIPNYTKADMEELFKWARHGRNNAMIGVNTEIIEIPPHERLLKVLKTERECVSRDCNRDCGKCDLPLEQDEVLSAYDTLIRLFAGPSEEVKNENPPLQKRR